MPQNATKDRGTPFYASGSGSRLDGRWEPFTGEPETAGRLVHLYADRNAGEVFKLATR